MSRNGGGRADGAVDFADWFNLGWDLEVWEEAVHLGRYGIIMTLLTLEDLPSPEEMEEEREIQERGQARFRR